MTRHAYLLSALRSPLSPSPPSPSIALCFAFFRVCSKPLVPLSTTISVSGSVSLSISRVGNPEYNLAQGAFRSGKYKYLANEVCSAWFTYDSKTLLEDPLANVSLACGGSPCSDCGQSCTSYNYTDFLFDVEADPREEHNLIAELPEVSHFCRLFVMF